MRLTLIFIPPQPFGFNKVIDRLSVEMTWFGFVHMALSMLVTATLGVIVVDTEHRQGLKSASLDLEAAVKEE